MLAYDSLKCWLLTGRLFFKLLLLSWKVHLLLCGPSVYWTKWHIPITSHARIIVGHGSKAWAENFTTVFLPPFFFYTFVIFVGKKLTIRERLSTGWRYFLLFVLQWQLAIYLDEICEIKCQNHLSMQNKRVFLLTVPLW